MVVEVYDGADGFTSLIKFCGRVCHFSRHRRLVGHASNFAFLREVQTAKKKKKKKKMKKEKKKKEKRRRRKALPRFPSFLAAS